MGTRVDKAHGPVLLLTTNPVLIDLCGGGVPVHVDDPDVERER